MTDVNTEFPDTFSYNESDLDRDGPAFAGYRVTEKEEIFKAVITKAKKDWGINEKDPSKSTNNIQLVLTLQALDGSDNPVTIKMGSEDKPLEMRHWVVVPVPNAQVPGHKPWSDAEGQTKLKRKARDFVRAVAGDEALPPSPKKIEGKGYVNSDGEVLAGKELDAAFKAVDRAAVNQLQTWFKDPDALVGAVVYFATYKAQSGYTKISYFRNDDGGKSVITENFTA